MWYSLKHHAGESDSGFSLEQDVENVQEKLEHQLFALAT